MSTGQLHDPHHLDEVRDLQAQEVPYGYCHCGCGQKTNLIKHTRAALGLVKGQPRRFLKGHHYRLNPRTRPLEERFWEKVDKRAPDECWEWQGSTRGSGYGSINERPGKRTQAHRVSYEMLVGPIPDGLEIDHLCRNRACVNPAHLEPVTTRENCLRGESPAAQYARRTHCRHGHPLSGDNVSIKDGARRCLQCHRDRERVPNRERMRRKRAKA